MMSILILILWPGFEERSQQVHSEDTDSEHYIPEVFMSVECPPYTDPPPPYSPPKPPQILPGEQPPPYEELNQNGDANGNSARENRNEVTQSSLQGTEDATIQRGAFPLSELGVSEVRSLSEPRGGQQETSLYRDRPGPVSVPARENIQLEQQAVQHRPSRASDYCMEVRQPGRSPGGRVAYSLPAYASTDIVGCVGMVLSPEEIQASYPAPSTDPTTTAWYPTAGRWEERDVRERGQAVRRNASGTPPSARESHSHRRRRDGSGRASSYTAQTLPATTAFQRFSNLFKRNSWRGKSRRRSQAASRGRGVSDCQTSASPAQYSTLPAAERRPPSASHLYAGFDLSDCNFYPTTASPSTSSSNSSSGGDQLAALSMHPLGESFPHSVLGGAQCGGGSAGGGHSHRPATRRSIAGCGDRSQFMFDGSCMSPHHREQFQDDLRRHLPPMCRQSADFNSSQNRDGRELSARPRTYYDGSSRERSDPLALSSQEVIHSGAEPVPRNILSTSQRDWQRAQAMAPAGQQSVTQPSTHTQLETSDPQRSLASLMCSNLPATNIALSSRNPDVELGATLSNTVDTNSCATEEVTIPQSSNANADSSSSYQSPEESPLNPSSDPDPNSLSHDLVTDDNVIHLPHTMCDLQQTSEVSLRPTPHANFPSVDMPGEHGAIRRSHSDTSEGSLFSVCSETGEQKLKAGTRPEDLDGASTLPADCPYPQHPSLESGRGSLPVLKHGNINSGVEFSPGCGRSKKAFAKPEPGSSVKLLSIGPRDQCWAHGGLSVLTDAATGNTVVQDENDTGDSLEHQGQSRISELCSSGGLITKSETVCSDVDYNLNVSPPTRKRLASKDLLPVVGEDRMIKSVNIPPLGSMASPLSGSFLEQTGQKTSEPSLCDLEGATDARETQGKMADGSKKRRKKPTSRGLPSPMYHGGAKQRASNWRERTELYSINPSSEWDSKLIKNCSKRRAQQGLIQPPVTHPCPHSDTQLFGDSALIHGSADISRGRAYPQAGAPLCPAMEALRNNTASMDVPKSRLDSDLLLGMNDLNQPPRKLIGLYGGDSQGDGSSTRPPTSDSLDADRAFTQQTKKKGGSGQAQHAHHRRQTSAGALDRSGGRMVSPARRKLRPKSLAAPSEMDTGVHDRRLNSSGATRPRSGAEVCPSRGRARSGFGHDMSLDGESGMADFHICSTASSGQPSGIGFAAIVGTAVQPKGGWKPDSSRNPGDCGPNGGSVNTSNRSGPSKDLSFVGRPATGRGRGCSGYRSRKRQSLPAFNPDTADTISGLGQTGESGNRPRYDIHDHLRVKGVTRTLSEEDVREATSYV